MDFIKEKIRVFCEKLTELKKLECKELVYEYIPCPNYKKSNIPPEVGEDWKVADSQQRFDGVDAHYWLHLTVPAIETKHGCELRLAVTTGREGQWDASNPQFTVFINGKTTQAFDINHRWLPLEYGKEYDVYLYLYTGMEGGAFDAIFTLETVELSIEALFYDISVPYQCMLEMEESDYNYIKIRDSLDKALMLLDLRHTYSPDFYESIRRTANYMKEEFYQKVCGDVQSIISCIGHTHIDVAWMWTVAQTREKAQRSFSIVLNMLRKYPDYLFMSSQPQLYQYVKEDDPELYEEIKERVRQGCWEPEGAMWLEADTNLVSGESLVRQILYGKRFFREEFGIDSNTLWLPDVFGYSGALPQIMKKSGVTRFFTTKMQWNESNKMPNDVFIWEGIDGSQVFTSFTTAYLTMLDPHQVMESWKEFKNKSLSDHQLLTFGYADGGGGPTYEMMENHRRLQYGIPGMPKTVMEKAGAFLDRIEKDFAQNTKELCHTPKWVGEMYLEMHRGTYTSVAKNKRNNRKSELLYQEIEALAVTDMLLAGGAYPAELFRKNQTNILLNQFHDIIPGSSIKEVYDVTDKEYERILAEGSQVKKKSLERLRTRLNTKGGVFVYNPTPFEISDCVQNDGVCIYAEKVPPHGWRVVPETTTSTVVTVTGNSIENELIRVEFNEKYHIISVYDKEIRREVIAHGTEANRLEVYEDYPRNYDAWEITNYYKQKMWVADQVEQVTLLDNGLRIRRRYQKSEICQDVTLRPGSKRVDFATHVDWHEDHVLLKAAFPVDIHNTYATYDIQFGNLQRPTHTNTSWDAAKFEVSAHKWADLSEGDYGVSILNDCKYGYSILGNEMRISLLKAATFPNPEADRGHHEFIYALFPHCGDYRQGGVVKEGYLLNMPLEAVRVSSGNGSLEDCFSLVRTDKENLVAETVKQAEDGNGIILRLYETYNQKTEATVEVGFDFERVYLCDLMENHLEELSTEGRCVQIRAGNFEILTLKFV